MMRSKKTLNVSYDDVADTFSKLSASGLDGMALGMVNYIDEMPHLRDGVLPRMERVGLRLPVGANPAHVS
jgi:hypothetical protein